MSLRHALLGQLASARYSGYALTKHFAGSLGYAWPASHSQIYPELARLREEGLIRQTDEGPRRRRSYEATARGEEEVRRWLRTPPDRTVRSEPLLRIFLLWLLPRDEAAASLRREADYHRELLAELERIAEDEPDPASPKELAYRLALEHGLRTTRARVEWAEWAATRVEQAEWPSRRRAQPDARARRRARASPRRSG